MRIRSQILLAAAVALAAAGCEREPAMAGLAMPTIDTLPGGRILVANAGATMWVDTSGWRIVADHVIQPAEGTDGELSDVTKLVADDAGNVYVMQIKPTVIKAFDAQGRWIRNIGRQGNGPGEFPDGMLGIRGDTLIVQDPNNQRITTFLTNGTLLGSARSQCCNFSSTLPVLDDGTVMIMGPAPTGVTDARSAYYLTRLDGTVTDTILRPSALPRDRAATMWSASQKIGTNTSTMDIGIPGLPTEQVAWRGDGMLLSGNTSTYTIVVRRGYRDTLRIIEAQAPTLVRTDAERDAMLEQAISAQGPRWRDALRAVANVAQIPRERSRWSALATDREHRIWVGLPGDSASVAILDVFSPDGVLLGKVPAPHPRILDGYWTRTHVYLIDADADGRALIRVYRIVTTAS